MQVYEQFSEQLVNWVQNIALPHLVTMMTGVVTTVSVVVDILIGHHHRSLYPERQGDLLRAGQKR